MAGLFKIVETLFEVSIRRDIGADVAPERRVLPHRARRPEGRPVLSRPFCPRRQARRRLDGRRARPLAAPRQRRAANAGRAAGLQLRQRRRRQAAAAHARRRDHPLPRVRPRPAPHAHPGQRARRVGHQRRRVGRGRAAEPVHGKLLLGVGRAQAHDRPRRHRRAAAPRAVRQDDRGQELPERPADAAPDRVLAVRHAAAHRVPRGRRQDRAT